jgi:hypothetical protein
MCPSVSNTSRDNSSYWTPSPAIKKNKLVLVQINKKYLARDAK